MKKVFIFTLITFSILFFSCEKAILERSSTDKKEVFEFFWNSIDTKYSFFDLKNIDWNGAHERFSKGISNEMTDEAFFDTLSVMIDLLKDGHSGIKSSFNEHKYVGFFTRGAENFDPRLIMDHYAHGWGSVTGPFNHISLSDGQIAYIYYGDFGQEITDDDIDYLINKYQNTKGMIIDIRNNFGGSASNIYMLAKRFINAETHLFDSRLKNGPGHNDFTSLTNIKISPSEKTYSGKVCLLTNRKVYSAASVFTLAMHEIPSVTVIGDTTGGGLGLPVGIELPNEWQIHCAGTQLLSVKGENFELGIPPDIHVEMKKGDMEKGVDSIIEEAIRTILEEPMPY
jgi:hypothetical protein